MMRRMITDSYLSDISFVPDLRYYPVLVGSKWLPKRRGNVKRMVGANAAFLATK